MINLHPGPAGHFVLHTKALHGRPYDGHTLKTVIDAMQAQTGIEPERIYVHKGYRGHDYPHKLRVFKSGQKRGITPTIKRELRRRSAVEPVIGHLKSDARLNRNFLKGSLGDKLNALLSGFQLPTFFIAKLNPNAISVSRDKPLHMTILPGGESQARAR